jgi:hypothetical protein
VVQTELTGPSPKSSATPKKESGEVPEPTADGLFTVTGIQGNVNPPVEKKKVITKPGSVTVTSGKTRFTMKPSQTFLNTSLSEYLSRVPPEPATINVKLPTATLNEPPDVRAISDAHHRFVWSAVHGQQVRLAEQLGTNGIEPWSALTYGASANNKGQLRSAVITDEMRAKYFERWVGLGLGATPARFVSTTIKRHPSTETTPETVADYTSYIEAAVKSYRYRFGFEEFVKDLASKVGPEGARYREQLMARTIKKDHAVLVVSNNPTSRGHYDPATKVINLQENPPLSMLDTLLFETGNAERKKDYADLEQTPMEAAKKGYRKAEIEFDVDVQYIDSLMKAYGATSLEQLVVAFKIDKRWLVKADVSTVLSKPKPPYVDMPTSTELPTQSHRQALWFWKTQGWPLKDQKHVWVIENHTNLGMGASDRAYTKV